MDNRIIGLVVVILLLTALFINHIDIKRIWANALAWVRNLIRILVNPKMLLTFGIAWMLTNGWSYILLAVGARYQIEWMLWVAGSYQAFLWFPLTAEKIVTIAIAIVLAKFMFPHDRKLQARLRELSPKNIVK